MEWLSILLLAALAMCIYKIWAANNKKSANEREFVEDHDAQTARLKQEHQEQLRAAHAERDLEKRANGSLRHENSTLAAAANRRGREQREIERQRREIYDLKEELSDATYDRSTVETASIVKEQWTSISDTLAKAGFVAKTPNDLARSIESLLELRDSAAASPNQAALDKKELANEKAAKEAAQRKLRKAEDTIRQKDSTIATLNEQKDAEIAALRADLKKTEMNGPTTSSLQQELSQTKAALAEAQKKINFLQTEGDALLEKHESIMTEGRALHEKHESLKTEGQALYEN
jgi:DNA repair exonuclease SbcCD ATPase subunit